MIPQSSSKNSKDHQSKPVTILEDACEGVDPGCDAEIAFRTITGQCNNLDEPYWGPMSTAFLRDIEIGEYNPKTEFIVTGDAADGGQYGRKSKGGSNNSNNNNKDKCIAR